MIFDDRRCELGEGPLWHPERGQLFWFDILGRRLLTPGQEWRFADYVSAAGWVSRDELLIASSRELFLFNLESGTRRHILPLEADNPVTRSNDGRADPWGGFWIGTMGVKIEPEAGAIYRYYQGELRQLLGAMTVPNAICFSADRRFAYFTDTDTQIIKRQPLDAGSGWPDGDPETFIDLTGTDFRPDGAVVAADGTIWNAQWGAARVAAYSSDGEFLQAIEVPGKQSSCPAFGGTDLTTLHVTTAAEGLKGAAEGLTYAIEDVAKGLPEYQVKL